jgi:hypothetical protein
MGLQFCYLGTGDYEEEAFRLLLLFSAKIDKSRWDQILSSLQDRVSDADANVIATRERVNELNQAFIRIQRRLLGAP